MYIGCRSAGLLLFATILATVEDTPEETARSERAGAESRAKLWSRAIHDLAL